MAKTNDINDALKLVVRLFSLELVALMYVLEIPIVCVLI
jgi:hypothetical protein